MVQGKLGSIYEKAKSKNYVRKHKLFSESEIEEGVGPIQNRRGRIQTTASDLLKFSKVAGPQKEGKANSIIRGSLIHLILKWN